MAIVAPVVEEGGVVVIRALLFPFIVLAGYFVAWGIVFCMDALVRAFFGTAEGLVGWVPFAGRILTSPLHAIEKKLTSFLGGLEAHFEHQMATRWHQLAELFERWAGDIEANAVADWTLAKHIYSIARKVATGQYAKDLTRWVHAQIAHLHGVQTVVIRKTTVIEKTIVQKGKAGALTVTKPIAAEIAGVIEIDLPRIRARERALSDELARLWKWAHRRGGVIAAGIGLGALAYALGRLGLGWLRCSNVKRAGKRVCGMDHSLLESMLADTLAIVGTVSLVEFIRDAQAVEAVALDALSGFIREMPKV